MPAATRFHKPSDLLSVNMDPTQCFEAGVLACHRRLQASVLQVQGYRRLLLPFTRRRRP